MTRLVVVGDALLDRDLVGSVDRLCPDAPVPVVDRITARERPGGAGLAAALAAGDGHDVTLVTALGDDDAGHILRHLLDVHHVRLVVCGSRAATPEKVRVLSLDHPLVRLDYGDRDPAPLGSMPRAAQAALLEADAALVSDYGRGLTGDAQLRRILAAAVGRIPVVWDPHPRGAPPVTDATLATPNSTEAGLDGDPGLQEVARRALEVLGRWRAKAVAVTLGARGALLVRSGEVPMAVPVSDLTPGDGCGAGDRFAVSAAAALGEGASAPEAVEVAVTKAAAFVAGGGAARVTAPVDGRPDQPSARALDASAVIAAVRARGGTVVATSGCFDLLHPGHVHVLHQARALGDCLVVCLNSDASVRRLKGDGRPLQPVEDRTAVLLGLGSVDAVAVFDDDTPQRVLDLLQPDVFVKGGDYSLDTLPEASAVRRWGGEAVVVPYLKGRSTTRLVREASRHAQT